MAYLDILKGLYTKLVVRADSENVQKTENFFLDILGLLNNAEEKLIEAKGKSKDDEFPDI